MRSKNHGSVLLTTLLSLLLLASLTQVISIKIRALINIFGDFNKPQVEYLSETSKLISNISSEFSDGCNPNKDSLICIKKSPKTRAINYYNLYNSHKKLLCGNIQLFRKTRSGLRLDYPSLVADQYCSTIPTYLNRLTVKGNFDSLTPLHFNSTLANVSLAIEGYLSSSIVIERPRQINITTAGDLIIDLVECKNSNGCLLSLISATGFIKLKNLIGTTQIYFYSKYPPIAPENSALIPIDINNFEELSPLVLNITD